MKLFKAFKKTVVIYTVLLFIVVSSSNIFAYSPSDLIYNDILHLPHFPDDGHSFHLVFTQKAGPGDIELYTFVSNNVLLYYSDYYINYGIRNNDKTKINKYILNENFEWEFLSSSSSKFQRFEFYAPSSTYGQEYLLYYYTDFDFYYEYPNELLISPSTLDNEVEFVNSYDDIFPEPVPEGWFNEIMQAVSSFVGGLLDSLVAPLEGIANALNSMWNSIKNIPQAISDKLEYLFVPSGDKFSELKNKFDEKFGFVGQIIDLGEVIINATFGGSKPNSNITLYGGTYTIIDWDIYDDYRPYIHGIIVLLSYIVFIPKLIKRLPSVIRGI